MGVYQAAKPVPAAAKANAGEGAEFQDLLALLMG
jgi:hypothetical protein